ncbi:ABC transporter permease [Spirosoma terrae]|uniref:FtsX-like permease family protein n=1 Tax=Spirosoma terrae TaxID=1968276 RepID=A0A6L9LJ42_9BACT|nr:ABC transporter permease [Spirosoma terrae]NDU98943.1 FtsX-like permease family protein [Spirosoma terrae]
MIKSYFITTFRALKRNWNYSLLNIIGLTFSLACCLLLFLAVRYELSFDRHHRNSERVFRLISHYKTPTVDGYNMGMPMPLIAALRNDFPELKNNATMIQDIGNVVVSTVKGEKQRIQEGSSAIAFVDPTYFSIFDYKWLKGSPTTSLRNPNSVVLTESTARKYFGSANPIGKTLRFDSRMDCQVTGLVADPPITSDFPFGLMISFSSLKQYGANTDWEDWNSTYSGTQVYMRLPATRSAADITRQLVAFKNKYKSPEDAAEETYELQPLSDVHFATRMMNYSHRTVGREMIWAMSLIGLFLLITACVNFINLATAQAIRRAKEVGVRKVLGSSRWQLVRQFLGETALLTACAVLLALGLAQVSMPYITDLLNIKLDSLRLSDPLVIGFLVALTLFTTLLSGFYPALILSGYQPVLALKGKLKASGTRSFSLRQGLIVLQFAISQILIIGTIVAYNQMERFRSADLGFAKDAIVTIPIPEKKPGQLASLKAKLAAYPEVESFSYSMSSPSANGNWSTSLRIGNADKDADFSAVMRPADTAYVKTYGLTLLAGRMYYPADTMREVVVNETFVKKMNLQQPQQIIGQLISLGGSATRIPIVGVVKDFNTYSLHRQTSACILGSHSDAYQIANLKLSKQANTVGTISPLMSRIERDWATTFPNHLFKYTFVDEEIARFYASEERMFKLFQLLAGIAVAIGCLGLFGVVAYMAEARTKEVGIRKVLGASVGSIFRLFSIDFVKLVLIALVVASPIAWYIMGKWLDNFAYKIELAWWMFALAGLFAIVVAVLTVSFQSIKAALVNPIKSLRSE